MTFKISPTKVLRSAISGDIDRVIVIARMKNGKLEVSASDSTIEHRKDIAEFNEKFMRGDYLNEGDGPIVPDEEPNG